VPLLRYADLEGDADLVELRKPWRRNCCVTIPERRRAPSACAGWEIAKSC
jgi:hypothetical protein